MNADFTALLSNLIGDGTNVNNSDNSNNTNTNTNNNNYYYNSPTGRHGQAVCDLGRRRKKLNFERGCGESGGTKFLRLLKKSRGQLRQGVRYLCKRKRNQ